jgi:hypothetical protein
MPVALQSMNPVVEASLISGGWATVVAALGYSFNRATTTATIQAVNTNAMNALDAAHAAQLWEKRAEAYVDAITAITRRRARRQYLASPVQIGDGEAQKRVVEEAFTAPKDEDWARASAQIAVYATQSVRDSMLAANKADSQVTVNLMYHKFLTERLNISGPGGPTGEQIMAAFNAIRAAAEAGNQADSALEILIQADLELRPSATLRPSRSKGGELTSTLS